MTLDIYADELVPQPTSRTAGRGRNGWLGGVLLVVAVLALGIAGLFSLTPKPSPGPGPDPIPDVRPIEKGLHVVIVEETKDRWNLPGGQIAIFTSGLLADWYKANCAQVDGWQAYRNFDVNDDLSKENPIWADLKARVTLPPPAVLFADGKRFVQMPLPPNPQAMIAALEKFKNGK